MRQKPTPCPKSKNKMKLIWNSDWILKRVDNWIQYGLLYEIIYFGCFFWLLYEFLICFLYSVFSFSPYGALLEQCAENRCLNHVRNNRNRCLNPSETVFAPKSLFKPFRNDRNRCLNPSKKFFGTKIVVWTISKWPNLVSEPFLAFFCEPESLCEPFRDGC